MSFNSFFRNNPNRKIFRIEPELGFDSNDKMASMIGDATLKHVASLSHFERQAWEYYNHTDRGNIFTYIPSPYYNDSDPEKMMAEDLDNYLDIYGIPEEERAVYEEVIQEERTRRAKSEDVCSSRENLVPFEEWHLYPQMQKHIDIGPSPKDISYFCGNSNQAHYDEFPDSPILAEITNFILQQVSSSRFTLSLQPPSYILSRIVQYKGNLLRGPFFKFWTKTRESPKDFDRFSIEFLTEVEELYRQEYNSEVLEKNRKAPITQLFEFKIKEWEEMEAQGLSPYKSVKAFGRLLFEKFKQSKNIQFNWSKHSYYWNKYNKLKRRFAPSLKVGGYDLNKCSLREIQEALQINRQLATNVWFARPLEYMLDLEIKARIDRKVFCHSDKTKSLALVIDKSAKMADETNSLVHLKNVASKLHQKQRNLTSVMTDSEWDSIWNYYKISRDEVIRNIRKRAEENKKKNLNV